MPVRRQASCLATAELASLWSSVPNNTTNTVQVIDPNTFQVIATYPTGREPQHVMPSWDLKMLWVNDDLGNDMVPINPVTGKPVNCPCQDPYNLLLHSRRQPRAGDGRAAAIASTSINPQTMGFERSSAGFPATASNQRRLLRRPVLLRGQL